MSTGDHGHVWDSDAYPCTPISEDVCLTPYSVADPDGPPGDDGYWFCHDVPGSDHRCHGRVALRREDGGPVWTQTGTLGGGDLTLSPSVLCIYKAAALSHEFHGWVRDGKWVPA